MSPAELAGYDFGTAVLLQQRLRKYLDSGQ